MKINEIIEKERRIKSIKSKKGLINEFSRCLLLSGQEHNQDLQDYVKDYNTIDFGSALRRKTPEIIEIEIREIWQNQKNKRAIEEEKYPIIWFKDLDKCGESLEEALLPIFDSQQNFELFKEVNLAKFILISTTSSNGFLKFSGPLLSRLDVVNITEFQTKQFFLDKYFKPIFFSSLFFNLALIFLIFVPRCKRHLIKWKCNCK